RVQGFPKYKSKKNRQTYRTNNQKNSIRIENGYIKLPKIGFVKEYNLLTLELFSSASRKDYY
ncbi:transposase, partial [Borreliella burgdorferi]